MLQLLQIAIGTRQRLSRPWIAEDWRRAYHEARHHALVGVCWEAIEQIGEAADTMDEELAGRWFADALTIQDHNAMLHQRVQHLQQLLAESGYHGTVLKGIAVAQHYPRPELRQCGDIDIWVPGPSRAELLHFFRQRGYHIGEVVWHHADVHIFPDLETEVHFLPSWLFNPWHNRQLQKLCATGRIGQDGLTEATYLLLHIFRHLFQEGVGLRHLLDYYLATRGGLTAEDRRQMHLLGLAPLAAAVDEVCGLCFTATEAEAKDISTLSRRGRHLFAEVWMTGDFGGKGKKTNRRQRLLAGHRQALRWMCDYPAEALWELPWRLWHYFWRRSNGYLK